MSDSKARHRYYWICLTAALFLLVTLIGVGGARAEVTLSGLTDVGEFIPGVRVEMKYASSDNFMKKNVYGELKRCFLVPVAAEKLRSAASLLKKRNSELTFVLYDCARPESVQRIMWEQVKDTPDRKYVANPTTAVGSIHSYGCAVDLSLYDEKRGQALDMGTAFDFFGPEAEPQLEMRFLKEGKLTSEQLANRLLLREVMLRAGFEPLSHEWWHFNCEKGSIAMKRFRRIP